ncbi:zf-TFIIB domain-containing protein [Azonexus sp.]|uniref:TFIIB-type zinc ribbon-containing protein n=1 Tax=Azonexus sp. TaxID=1872668 RepID=UPI0035B4DBCA
MLPKSLACACGAALFTRELAPGLPARTCSACGGTLLALDEYRLWRQSASLPAAGPTTALPELPEDTGKARRCPACGAPMARYRVAPGSSFRLDRCARCQLVWFDGGEWPALVESGLIDRLDSILADAWQKRIQAEETRQRRETTLRQRLGDEVVDELQRIQSWLQQRPNSGELLALLSGEPI